MRGAVSRKGWVLFAVMCLVWGIPYLFIKVAVGEVSVPVVVFARTALGALLLLPLALRASRKSGGQLGTLRRHWRPLVAFAALEIIVPWGLLSAAERKLPSSLAGLLIAAVPIISVVTARLTGGTERLSPRRWAGLVIGLAGVVLLAAPDLGGGSGLAVGEVLLVALGYATAPLIAARKLADVPALPMTAACLSLGALVWLPAAVLTWPHAGAVGPRAGRPGRARRHLHGLRVPRLPRADQGGGHVAGDGLHLHQPRRGRGGGRRLPVRALHGHDRRVVRADPGGLAAGHLDRPQPG